VVTGFGVASVWASGGDFATRFQASAGFRSPSTDPPVNSKILLPLLSLGCAYRLEGPKPTLEADQAGTLCGDLGRPQGVRGSGLSPMVIDGATDHPGIDLPDVCLVQVAEADGTPVADAEEICLPEQSVRWISQSEIEFTVGADSGVGPGVYDVLVRNPDGTEARGRFRLTVLGEGPLVFWVDPPYVYNGISTQIIVYGSALGEIERSGTCARWSTFSVTEPSRNFWKPDSP